MNETMIALIVTEIGELTGTLEERCKAAFDKAIDHWMVTDPNVQVQGALAAVMLSYEEEAEERRRLEMSTKLVRSLSAASTGIPVDLGALFNEAKDLEPVPYQKWWKECGGRVE